MRTKQLIRNLKEALSQDYLYNTEELKFMREQLSSLEEEFVKSKRKKPEGFGKK